MSSLTTARPVVRVKISLRVVRLFIDEEPRYIDMIKNVTFDKGVGVIVVGADSSNPLKPELFEDPDMEISISEFVKPGSQLILPLFEGNEKAPNNSLTGLGRSQRSLVREAISSGDFDAKKGNRVISSSPQGIRELGVPVPISLRGYEAPRP